MRKLYDTKNLKTHRKADVCQKAQSTGYCCTPSLRTFFHKAGDLQPSRKSAAPLSPHQQIRVPCPGLSKEGRPKVAQYLRRTSTAGGGAPSRTKLAGILFGKDVRWRDLSMRQKDIVCRREIALYRWRNFRNLGTVFSASCCLEVTIGSQTEEPTPCQQCLDLLSLKVFQTQL